MSKAKVHVIIPYTTEVACGAASFYRNALTRNQVTCKQCQQTEYYKALPLSKKIRK